MLRFISQLDDSHFAAALRRMEAGAMKAGGVIGKAFSGIGGVSGATSALGLAGITISANSAINRLSALADAAASVDMNVEEYQRVAFALAQGGAKAEDARKGIANLSDSLVEARDPASSAAKAMTALGVSLEDFSNADPVSSFAKLADAVKGADDRAQAFAAVSDLVGAKLAIKLLPALSEGGAKFREVANSADVATQALVDFGDQLGDKREKALTDFGNFIQNKLYLAGKLGADAFAKGSRDGGGGLFGKLMGGINANRAVLTSYFDPDAAMRLAGDDPAVDPAQLKRNDAAVAADAVQKEATKRAIAQKKIDDENIASDKRNLEINKELSDRGNKYAEEKIREEERNIAALSKMARDIQLQTDEAGRKWNEKVGEIREEEAMEKQKSGLEAKLKAAEDAQAAAQSRLQTGEQALSDFNRMGPDERRDANRAALDEKRFKAREKRMEGKEGARAGDKRLADEIKDAKVQAEFAEAQIDRIVAKIAELMPK